MDNDQIKLLKQRWTAAKEQRSWQRTGTFVTLTMAQSLDGYISCSDSQQTRISGTESSKLTHAFRAWHSGILVGANTLQVDNPRLTVRGDFPGAVRQPQRIVLSSKINFDLDRKVLNDEQTKPWFFCSSMVSARKHKLLLELGCRVSMIPMRGGLLDLYKCLDELWESGITDLMVEGGCQVASSFLELQLVDYLVLTIAPILLGNPDAVPMHRSRSKSFPVLRDSKSYRFGADTVVEGAVDYGRHANRCIQGKSSDIPRESVFDS